MTTPPCGDKIRTFDGSSRGSLGSSLSCVNAAPNQCRHAHITSNLGIVFCHQYAQKSGRREHEEGCWQCKGKSITSDPRNPSVNPPSLESGSSSPKGRRGKLKESRSRRCRVVKRRQIQRKKVHTDPPNHSYSPSGWTGFVNLFIFPEKKPRPKRPRPHVKRPKRTPSLQKKNAMPPPNRKTQKPRPRKPLPPPPVVLTSTNSMTLLKTDHLMLSTLPVSITLWMPCH